MRRLEGPKSLRRMSSPFRNVAGGHHARKRANEDARANLVPRENPGNEFASQDLKNYLKMDFHCHVMFTQVNEIEAM